MIIDNKTNNSLLQEWIAQYTEAGNMDLVTGYFTIGALAWLARQTNGMINRYRMVLGDIVNTNSEQDRTIDLLHENIAIEAALQLSPQARKAVEFLQQMKVEVKTLEPNFCHAKAYLFSSQTDGRHSWFVTGSSNLTEAGMGLKPTHNFELNLAETGDNNQYQQLLGWFDSLWESPEAHRNKSIAGGSGTMPIKEYLIREIQKIFREYTPNDVYMRLLLTLFGNQTPDAGTEPKFRRMVGRLEHTAIYNSLYKFQQSAVLSLIKMLQEQNGAILADAVGLGKTWTALAVMKYYQMQGREVLLLCAKKLQWNWLQYKKNQDSRFERDELDYFIRFHTDLIPGRLYRYTDRADRLFVNDRPKLLVIDESHNLRNAKSTRYKFLVEQILSRNEDVKVLMLSATPINTSLIDIRNQFKLIKQGRTDGFRQSHKIGNLDHLFNRAQTAFKEWKQGGSMRIGDFIAKLPADFFRLTDSLTVARTRPMIQSQMTDLVFPNKATPVNIFTDFSIVGYSNFEQMVNNFPPLLSGYQPAFYIEQEGNVKKIHDEKQRDRFLVKMLYILLVKRLESSWKAFQSTVKVLLDHHKNALYLVEQYCKNSPTDDQANHSSVEIDFSYNTVTDDEEDIELEYDVADLELGKRRPIKIAEIDNAGNLEALKSDLSTDIKALETLFANLVGFAKRVGAETSESTGTNLRQSIDSKLQRLMDKITAKQKRGSNDGNKKVLVFTVYKDTAFYLYDQLVQRGFKNVAVISGDASKSDDMPESTNKFEPILERFAPYTKLFREKEWDFYPISQSDSDQFAEWKQWVGRHKPETHELLQRPIDILIATDVLSEGQNLQDCDMVVNYDIHWNPVRIVQRMGRIDRLGSPNKKIWGINFWPSNSMENYLNLKDRVEERMAIMKLAGSEVNTEFSEQFKTMSQDRNFEDRMNERMMRHMETSWDDIENHSEGLGFDNLSLEEFRQDLSGELLNPNNSYRSMPNGIYSGFQSPNSSCPNGIIALLGYPARPANTPDYHYAMHELLYIDREGQPILLNQKDILTMLARHKKDPRFVPKAVDMGENQTIADLATAFRKWLARQTSHTDSLPSGQTITGAGVATMDLLNKLKTGDSQALERSHEDRTAGEKYAMGNFDLIAWVLVEE